ncbi:MAG: NAD-dependent epimerase/dehydratase family protein [Ilumatobacter sp.]
MPHLSGAPVSTSVLISGGRRGCWETVGVSGPTVITGTTGSVGSALAAFLTARGERIVGVDQRPGSFTTVVGDLASIDRPGLRVRCRT